MSFITGVFKIAIRIVVGIILLVVLIAIGVGASASKHEDAIKGLHESMAEDTIKEYEMAKRNGTKMDVCVRAGLVAESYLQAKDEDRYAQWKATEKKDCRRAGLEQ